MTEIQQVAQIVMLAGEQVMTDSRKVAKEFGKQHRSILRAYRSLECSDEFRLHNFVQTVDMRQNPSGGAPIPTPIIQMTKDGFMFLAMGLTGKKAAAKKEAFIAACNEMAEFIRSQEYRHDMDHASRCGRDLAAWKGHKLVHVARLERLDPQIKLPLPQL